MAAAHAKVAFNIRQDIADRIHLFYDLVDGGKAASTADIFTEDARLTFGPGSPKPGTIEGPAIRDAMAARELQTSAFTRHMVSNLMFSPAADDAVSATYLLLLFRSDDETRNSMPAFVADVAETWALGGEWKLVERVISPAFARG
jgi:hypothetical protein